MNKTGGIFSGPTALGISDSGSGTSCNPSNTTLVRQVQTYLKANGAPNLKVDGVWQGCTASAFKKWSGRPYVTSDDIFKMTDQTCKSVDTWLGGVVPAFTLASINVCNDGSDGVGTGAGGGGGTAPPQQCPQGQAWNDTIRTCIPDPFGLLGGGGGSGGGGTQPSSQCPQGQTWNDLLKMCLPTIPGLNSGGGSGGVVNPPSECPSGTFKNPLDGQCYGAGGVTQPTECPDGQTKVLGQCVAGAGGAGDLMSTIGGLFGGLLGGGAQPTQPGQPAAPGGLTDIIAGVTGAIAGLFGGATGGCAPGMVLNPATGQCVGPGGVSVPPGWTNPALPGGETSSPWGTMSYVLVGVLGIGTVAVLSYVGYKAIKGKGGDYDALTPEETLLIDEELAAAAGGGFDLGDEQFQFQMNCRRRGRGRRKAKKSRRRGWRRRARGSRRRSRRSRRRWSRR